MKSIVLRLFIFSVSISTGLSETTTICSGDFVNGQTTINCPEGYFSTISTTFRYRSICYGSCISRVDALPCLGHERCVLTGQIRRRNRTCNNSVEVEYNCKIDTTSICASYDINLEQSVATFLAATPNSRRPDSQGCDMTVHPPQDLWINITLVRSDYSLVLWFCQLQDISYLYILENDYSYLRDNIMCNYRWTELRFSHTLESKTKVEIKFPEMNISDNYGLVLKFKATDKVTTTTASLTTTTTRRTTTTRATTTRATTTRATTTTTQKTTTIAPVVSRADTSPQSSQSSSDNKSTVVVIVTVVMGLVGIGIIICVGYFVYTYPDSKLNDFFRPSRALRRRPQVERNIYSAAHTGLRASEVRPPPPVRSNIPDLIRTASRSITAMRLPAIPPEVEEAVIQDRAQSTAPTGRPPATLPRDRSTLPAGTGLTPSAPSAAQDVPLPIPVNDNPEGGNSDSDDDDKEYIPKHRFSMVRKNPQDNSIGESSRDDGEAGNQGLQYVAVNVIKDEPIHATIAEVRASAITNGAVNIIGNAAEKKVEYAKINREKTLTMAEELAQEAVNKTTVEAVVEAEAAAAAQPENAFENAAYVCGDDLNGEITMTTPM